MKQCIVHSWPWIVHCYAVHNLRRTEFRSLIKFTVFHPKKSIEIGFSQKCGHIETIVCVPDDDVLDLQISFISNKNSLEKVSSRNDDVNESVSDSRCQLV